jgi:Ca2+-binding EF-hand superfamily protein
MINKNEIQGALIATACVLLAFSGVALAQFDRQAEFWERFSERHDEDGDGRVTAEEFGRSYPRFQSLDVDGDGAVTSEELEAAVAEMGGRPAPGHGLVRSADADRDGAVTREEWSARLAEIDSDGDGALTDEELTESFLRRHQRHQRRVAWRFGPPSAHLDFNEDGQLDFGDLDSLYSGLDADGDGTISAAEMPERIGGRSRGAGRFFRPDPEIGDGAESGFGPRGPHGPPGPGHHRLLRADEDGDGAVTLEEWNAMLDRFDRRAIFDALDADGDGVVSADEMEAARPRPGRFPRGAATPTE